MVYNFCLSKASPYLETIMREYCKRILCCLNTPLTFIVFFFPTLIAISEGILGKQKQLHSVNRCSPSMCIGQYLLRNQIFINEEVIGRKVGKNYLNMKDFMFFFLYIPMKNGETDILCLLQILSEFQFKQQLFLEPLRVHQSFSHMHSGIHQRQSGNVHMDFGRKSQYTFSFFFKFFFFF